MLLGLLYSVLVLELHVNEYPEATDWHIPVLTSEMGRRVLYGVYTRNLGPSTCPLASEAVEQNLPTP